MSLNSTSNEGAKASQLTALPGGKQVEAEPIVDRFADYTNVFKDDKSPGSVWKHNLVDYNDMEDYKEVYEVSVDKARQGSTVLILPVLTENDPLRSKVFPGAKERKCPDISVDGEYAEIKTPLDILHDNKISFAIRNCHDQADYVIIRLLTDYKVWDLKRIAKGRFKVHESLQKIEFKMNSKYYVFTRTSTL